MATDDRRALVERLWREVGLNYPPSALANDLDVALNTAKDLRKAHDEGSPLPADKTVAKIITFLNDREARRSPMIEPTAAQLAMAMIQEVIRLAHKNPSELKAWSDAQPGKPDRVD